MSDCLNPLTDRRHAEPDQAAQALSQLHISHRKPLPTAPRPSPQSPYNSQQGRPPSPRGRRPSPAGMAAQRAYAQQGSQPQTHQQYNDPNAHSQHASRLNSPPPPAEYGYGPRPSVEATAPRISSHPANNLPSQIPRTPAPPDADSQDLYEVFQLANGSRSGALTTYELGNAVVNQDGSQFDPRTINSLMKMFSSSPPGQHQGPTITYSEFQNLWRFLAAWRELFERFDEDRSGRISLNEFSKALAAFGYRLSHPFVGLLYQVHNGAGSRAGEERRGSLQDQGMSFDLFVQACISLKRMTDAFKGYDDDRDGYITVSFEEFLTEILKLRE